MTEPEELVQIEAGEFEGWLRAQPQDAVVGRARSPLSDPLSNFLSERFGQATMVGREKIRVGDRVFRLPDWAREYLRLADASESFIPITAGEALDLLARVASERVADLSRSGPPPDTAPA